MYRPNIDTYTTTVPPSDLTGGEDCFYVFMAITANEAVAYSDFNPAMHAERRRLAVDDWSRAIAAGFVDC